MNQRVIFSDPEAMRQMDPSELESYLPYMGMAHESFTKQQERLLILIGSGMSVAAAGRAAGYKTREAPAKFVQTEQAQKVLAFLREQIKEEVKFTQANAHAQFGLALELKGATNLAINHYQTALQFEPSHQAAEKALNRLNSPLE